MTGVFATAAGDTLSVGISGRFDSGPRTVRATIGDVDLRPDEARRLATALLEHAAGAERRARRSGGGMR